MGEIRLSYSVVQPATGGYSSVRLTLTYVEALSAGYPQARLSGMFLEPLVGGYPQLRGSFVGIQALFPVEEERPVSTDPFPGFGNSSTNPAIPQAADPFNSPLPGLSIEVTKTPRFRTRISEAASGNEVRYAQAEYPRWDFELSYEFLEDRSLADTSLKTIMGFFLARQGSFDSWLFKDPDDYLSVGGVCGTADGVTTEFPLCRTMGGFNERIGQVDTANTIKIYRTYTQTATVPATPGPYTITVANASGFVEDLGVAGLTRVSGVPAAGQYSVDELTGTYTFSAASEGSSVNITYRYEVDAADYTITLPNSVVFDSAPASGTITADFQFYYACRFVDDSMDFEKFADKLWNLQSVQFKSIIQ